MEMITIKNLNKFYNKNNVLSNINLTINKGECIGIMGESGSGKSTLAKLLVRLESFNNGDILFDNISYKNINKKEKNILCKKVQLVFQNSLASVNPKYNVKNVLEEPLKIHYSHISKDEKNKKIIDLLDKVQLSEDFLTKNVNELSGGQLQRVCIARALILEPDLIIFDESLSGLDPIIQQQILELLAFLKKNMNLTYIFIAHDFEICYYLCNKIFIIDNGKVIDTIKNLDLPINITNEKTKKLLGKSLNYINQK